MNWVHTMCQTLCIVHLIPKTTPKVRYQFKFTKEKNRCSQRLSTSHITLGKVRSEARFEIHICFQSLYFFYYSRSVSPFNINKNYIISHSYFSTYLVKYGDHEHVQSFLHSKKNIKVFSMKTMRVNLKNIIQWRITILLMKWLNIMY